MPAGQHPLATRLQNASASLLRQLAFAQKSDTIIDINEQLILEEYTMAAMQKQSVVGKDVPFERIRRITGYLVGTMDKWNDAKKAEERDRVKHL